MIYISVNQHSFSAGACLFGLINFYFLSHHILSKLWNFTLNTQVIVPRIHRVLPCSFLWLKIQHNIERSYRCDVYFFYQIHITGISIPTVMSPDTSSGFTHHRSIGTNSIHRRAFDQIPCQTLGGLDTYHSLSLLMFQQTTPFTKCYFIYKPHIITEASEHRYACD